MKAPLGPGGHPQGASQPRLLWHSVLARPVDTYSSLFTTPLPLGSNIRKALRMASSGSVPGRPREQVSMTRKLGFGIWDLGVEAEGMFSNTTLGLGVTSACGPGM